MPYRTEKNLKNLIMLDAIKTEIDKIFLIYNKYFKNGCIFCSLYPKLIINKQLKGCFQNKNENENPIE